MELLKEQIIKPKIFNVISLFSGGGFLDIGFVNQGFQIEEAIEIEPHFIKAYNYGLKTYFKNSKNDFIKNGYLHHKEIIQPIDASDEIEQGRLRSEYKNITGIIGGPPCQDYSIGGKNGGIKGDKGKLINSYLRIVKQVQPKFFFFENVEGLYKNKKHRASFDIFVNELEKEGYVIWHDILNVLEYGYPQNRPRIALVAFQKKIIRSLETKGFILEKNNDKLKTPHETDNYIFKWPQPKYENPKSFNWPKKWAFGNNFSKATTKGFDELCVYNIFKNLDASTPNQNEHFQPKSKKFLEIQEGDTYRKSFKRLHRYRYSPTVAYGNNEVHLHPIKPRRLTVREGLRLQTVPDEYVLPSDMPLTPKFKLISNGVPTAIAELIAKEVRRTLELYYQYRT